MNTFRRSILPLSLLLIGGAASAQQVSFRGKVEDVSGTTNQFIVDCTDVDLTSSAFNLNTFVGSQTRITGNWNGSIANPAVDVTAIELVAETFEIGGGGKIGDDATFGVTGTPGSPFAMFLSFGPSFVPFRAAGAVMVDPATLSPVASGVIGAAGNFQLKVQIPNNPALVGITIHGQGAIGLGGGNLLLTNPDCKTLES